MNSLLQIGISILLLTSRVSGAIISDLISSFDGWSDSKGLTLGTLECQGQTYLDLNKYQASKQYILNRNYKRISITFELWSVDYYLTSPVLLDIVINSIPVSYAWKFQFSSTTTMECGLSSEIDFYQKVTFSYTPNPDDDGLLLLTLDPYGGRFGIRNLQIENIGGSSTPNSHTVIEEKKDISGGAIAGIVVSILVFFVVLFGTYKFYKKRNLDRRQPKRPLVKITSVPDQDEPSRKKMNNDKKTAIRSSRNNVEQGEKGSTAGNLEEIKITSSESTPIQKKQHSI